MEDWTLLGVVQVIKRVDILGIICSSQRGVGESVMQRESKRSAYVLCRCKDRGWNGGRPMVRIWVGGGPVCMRL